jgi:hypothetical protein
MGAAYGQMPIRSALIAVAAACHLSVMGQALQLIIVKEAIDKGRNF